MEQIKKIPRLGQTCFNKLLSLRESDKNSDKRGFWQFSFRFSVTSSECILLQGHPAPCYLSLQNVVQPKQEMTCSFLWGSLVTLKCTGVERHEQMNQSLSVAVSPAWLGLTVFNTSDATLAAIITQSKPEWQRFPSSRILRYILTYHYDVVLCTKTVTISSSQDNHLFFQTFNSGAKKRRKPNSARLW